jgi:hypothetical protein
MSAIHQYLGRTLRASAAGPVGVRLLCDPIFPRPGGSEPQIVVTWSPWFCGEQVVKPTGLFWADGIQAASQIRLGRFFVP